eukprot:SAG31_NODE_12145_length_964_cov_1.473988_2_plen_123_part_01
MWRPCRAFAWAFTQFLVQKPGSLAIVSLTVGRYATAVVYGVNPEEDVSGEAGTTVKIFAATYIVCLTGINILPVNILARGQRVVTAAKPGVVIFIALLAAAYAVAQPTTIVANFGSASTRKPA